MTPRVSVIIPVYNSSAFLAEAVSSVAAQTFRDLELIIVDDGSTDDSVNVACVALAKSGLAGKVLDRPASAPKGAGASRNFGAIVAKGEFLAFLDSDDIWLPCHVQRAVTVFDENGHDVGAYCAMAKTFSDNETSLGFSPNGGFPSTGVQDAKAILLNGMIIPPNLCVRKSSFLQTRGFSEALACYEDWWLVLQLARITRFFFSPEVDSLVRVRLSSLSRQRSTDGALTMSPAMFRDQFGLFDEVTRSGLFSAEDEAQLREYVVGWNAKQISDLVAGGNIREGARIVSALWRPSIQSAGLTCAVLTRVCAAVSTRALKKLFRLLRGH